MGNKPSHPQSFELTPIFNCCAQYKHKDIVTAIYKVISKYQIEAMCECASWLLRYMLIIYRHYPENQVEILSGRVDKLYHVWVYDKIENYYIDITSEQFLDESKCLCTQDINDFYKLGYVITFETTTDQIYKSVLDEPFIVYDTDGNKITLIYLLNQVKRHLGIVGGKRTKKKKNKKKRNKQFKK